MTGEADDERLLFPATQRNRIPIGDALERHLPSQGLVLELASGSGEHGVTFQQRFPGLTWQCSDPDPEHCRSINSWIRHEGLSGTMPAALALDVREHHWRQHLSAAPQAIVCINLLQSLPGRARLRCWTTPRSCLNRAAPQRVRAVLRGWRPRQREQPPVRPELATANPSWGVRDQTTVIDHAAAVGLTLREIAYYPPTTA